MKKYFFAEEGDSLAGELGRKVRAFQEFVSKNGLLNVWYKNRAFYENRPFGNAVDVDVLDAGAAGELKAVSFNHFRNILRHTLNQTTSNIPAYDVSARTNTLRARRSAQIGRDIVKYYYRLKHFNRYMHDTAEKALVYGDGYLIAEFNPFIGAKIRPLEDGSVRREGDFEFDSLPPDCVFFDYTKPGFDKWDWAIFRRRKNKYELAALNPVREDEILNVRPFHEDDLYLHGSQFYSAYNTDTDDVYVYSAYHKAGNIFPNGKYCMWVGDKENGVMLYEGDNIYRERLPIFKLCPGDYLETSFGFTEANVLRTPQMIADSAVSYIVSNMEAFGTNNIWHPTGNAPTIEEIIDGLNLIQSDVKPEVISFFQDNPALFNTLNLSVSTMETLSGQNAVARGNVKDAPNLKSGIAVATVIQQAMAYSHAFEESYLQVFEDANNFLIETLSEIADDSEPRLYEIVGDKSRAQVRSFLKTDLSEVGRVIVDRVNPISQTPGGQIDIAMEMLKTGSIDKTEFFTVARTGKLETGTTVKDRMIDYVEAVKERLLSGEPVAPIPGIDHQYLIGQVQSLTYDLDMVGNPENRRICENIAALIKGHMQLARDGDEISALIFGGQPPVPLQIGREELNNGGAAALPPNNPPQQPLLPPAEGAQTS